MEVVHSFIETMGGLQISIILLIIQTPLLNKKISFVPLIDLTSNAYFKTKIKIKNKKIFLDVPLSIVPPPLSSPRSSNEFVLYFAVLRVERE